MVTATALTVTRTGSHGGSELVGIVQIVDLGWVWSWLHHGRPLSLGARICHTLVGHLLAMVLLQVLGVGGDRIFLGVGRLVREILELLRSQRRWIDVVREQKLVGGLHSRHLCRVIPNAHLLSRHSLLLGPSIGHHACLLGVELRLAL
jgi:hypothetical protein